MVPSNGDAIQMGGVFYRLGRMTGPVVRKGKWVIQSLVGSESDVIRAEFEVGRDMAQALAEEVALDYVYQAVGMRPYEGRRNRNRYNQRNVTISTAYRFIVGGPVFFSDDWDYYWVTPKGSSKEHGYVCSYGELAYQAATLAELTGDDKVKQHAIKMIRARTPFRRRTAS